MVDIQEAISLLLRYKSTSAVIDGLVEADEGIRRRERARRSGGEHVPQARIDAEALRYDVRKWVRGKVATAYGPGNPRKVPGEILEPLRFFAVHRTRNAYTVTHIPTGMRICNLFTGKGSKTLAKRFAEEVEKEAVASEDSWIFGDFGHYLDARQLDSFARHTVRAARRLGISDDQIRSALRHCNQRNIPLEDLE